MKPQQVIVSLDGMTRNEALALAWTLASSVWGFRVHDLLLMHGLDIIRDLKQLGKVFVDAKLYDTPTSVVHNVIRLNNAGADLISVHASGGREMLEAAVENTSSKILAVMPNKNSRMVYHRELDETIWDLAHLSYDAKAYGIVCTNEEIKMLKHLDFMKVTLDCNAEDADFFVIDKIND